jgi:tetratricopeptide (TPR) repeat protein
VLWIPILLAAALSGPAASSAIAADQAAPRAAWQADVDAHVAARDFDGALAVVDATLRDAPDEEDAHFWRARLLTWLTRWPEAEREYRRLIEASPDNTDYLIGLASVHLGQQQPADALNWLERARARDDKRADLFVARGRALRDLGRVSEARASFQRALALSPHDETALSAMATVRPEPRHRLSLGADVDHYNFSEGSRAFNESLRSAWNRTWATDLGVRVDQRAGITAWRALGDVSWRLPARSSLTVGGSAGPEKGIVSTTEVFVGGGKGFQLAGSFVRGVELNYEHRWLTFDQAHVMTTKPAATLYLPRDWQAMVSVTAARSEFAGLGSEWRPAGAARLTFPLASLLTGHVFYATGAENYALRDQIGSFSAWTVGGGTRVQFPGGRDLDVYVARQQREQGRVQTSVGLGHGFRF